MIIFSIKTKGKKIVSKLIDYPIGNDSIKLSIVRLNTKENNMNIIYGYCRCSKKKQVITRQVTNILNAFPDAVIYKEFYTGTTNDRKQWKKLKSIVKEGQTIVFDSVSRMSRNSEEGFRDYKELFLKGVNLVFLNEPHINTDVFKKSYEHMINVEIDSGNKAVNDYFKSNLQLVNKLLL